MTRKQGEFLGLSAHGFHRIVYQDWGDLQNYSGLLCVHGLTRNSRDFDPLARELSKNFRVVCPDMPGRGKSQWLSDPADYSYPTYLNNMAALLARLDLEEVNWVGTSMGGIIGMMLASLPGSPIARLVLNDVGPFLPKEALQRLATYVGADPHFESIQDLEAYYREIHAPFGSLTEEQWKYLAEHGVRQDPQGGYRQHYDPAIGHPFKTREIDDVNLWPIWSAVNCPVLLIHGASSDLLTIETVEQMKESKPDMRVVEVPDAGHAPALMGAAEIRSISRWLCETSPAATT